MVLHVLLPSLSISETYKSIVVSYSEVFYVLYLSLAPIPSTSWSSGTSEIKLESESKSSRPLVSAVATVSCSLFNSVQEPAYVSISSGALMFFSGSTSDSTYYPVCLSGTSVAFTG